MSSRFHIVLASVSLLAIGGCMQTQEQISYSNRTHTQIQAREVTAELKIDTVVSATRVRLNFRYQVRKSGEPETLIEGFTTHAGGTRAVMVA